MRQRRLLFLVFALVFVLRQPLAGQAPPVVEDFRLLVRVERALTAARIGQISGGCHLTTPNTGSEGHDQIRWIGPFGDRTNLVSFSQGALPPTLPAPPPCPPELVAARDAIRAVQARPETKIFEGAAAYPSR